MTINEKLIAVSGYIENTTNGSKKRNSETVISGKKSKRNIPVAIKMLEGCEKTISKVFFNL